VRGRLEGAGLELRAGIARTGLRALVRGSGPRTILFRADMDALPIQEESEKPYASTVPGVMHACGHDGHTSILTETALLSQEARAGLEGSLAFVFQPAEEGPGGARPMIEEGVLEDPAPEAAFGLHLWTGIPVGKIAVTSGPFMAAADEFRITIQGRGGHGALPHEAIDAVVVGSYLVTALQTLVSREADPMKTAVVTVGSFHGGSNFNIIAETAEMKGTLRTFDPALRERLVVRLREVCEGLARSLKAECEFVFEPHYPPTINDPAMAEFVAEVAAGLVGPQNVVRDLVVMGAEDMSYFLERLPGCYFFIGGANPEKGMSHPHHNPRFDFDEDALLLGCEMFLRIQESYFERFPQPPRRP